MVQVLTYGRLPLMNLWAMIILSCLWIWQTLPAGWFWVTLWIMIAAALSDMFDGLLARRFGVTSRLGSYGDPFMDKVYTSCTLSLLVLMAALSRQYGHSVLLALLTIVNLQRDHLTATLRSIGALHSTDARAHWVGKLRSAFSFPMICIVFSFLAAPSSSCLSGFPGWFVYALEIINIGLTICSVGVYMRQYWPTLKREIESEEV